MHKLPNNRGFAISLFAAVLVMAFILKVRFEHTYQPKQNDLVPVRFIEIERQEGGETVLLKGHFDQTVENGEPLIFRADHIRIAFYLNGEMRYSFGEPSVYPSISRSPGSQWAVFQAPEIRPVDEICIELTSCYENRFTDFTDSFLKQIYKGDIGVLLKNSLKKYSLDLLVGGSVCFSGILVLTVSLFLKLWRTPISSGPIHFSLFSIVVGLWPCIQYEWTSLVFPWYLPVSAVDILCMLLTCPLYLMYVVNFMKSRARLVIKSLQWMWLAALIIVLGTQAMGMRDAFEWLGILIVLFGLTVAACFACLIVECFSRRGRTHQAVRISLLSMVVFLCFVVVGIVNYALSLWPPNVSSVLSLLVFVSIHLLYLLPYLRECLFARQRVAELENELTQKQISIMLSQIKPHFLYNSLTAIAELCRNDSSKAEEATIAFSNYLRGNLDSLEEIRLVCFEKELEHVKTYLYLEQMRFGEELRVVYDIRTKDFLLPPLTIQPLVENAVKYGAMKKEDAGTVTVASYETESCYRIVVSDDGNGYAPEKEREDSRTHTGIANVTARLAAQCQGTVVIESEKGIGTTVTVSIPKEEWSSGLNIIGRLWS